MNLLKIMEKSGSKKPIIAYCGCAWVWTPEFEKLDVYTPNGITSYHVVDMCSNTTVSMHFAFCEE